MRAKAAGVLVLVGLTLVVAASAWGGSSSVRLYDAKATYKCLTKRPEYRPPSFEWYPGKPGVSPPPAMAFTMLVPRPPGFRNRGNFPYRGANVGPSWDFAVMSVRGFEFGPPLVVVFDKIASAQATYRIALHAAVPTLLKEARGENEVMRNVYVYWASPDGPKKQLRAIVVGCLRPK